MENEILNGIVKDVEEQVGLVIDQINYEIAQMHDEQITLFKEGLQKEQETFLKAAREIGIPEEYDPYQTLSFLPLSVLPKLRVTTSGLFDAVKNMELTY